MEYIPDQTRKEMLQAKLQVRQREYLRDPLRILGNSYGVERSWLDDSDLQLDNPPDSMPGTILVTTRDGVTSNLYLEDAESLELQKQSDIAWGKRDAMVAQNAYAIYQKIY